MDEGEREVGREEGRIEGESEGGIGEVKERGREGGDEEEYYDADYDENGLWWGSEGERRGRAERG